MAAFILAIMLLACAPPALSADDRSESADNGGYSVSGPTKTRVGTGSSPDSIYVTVTIANISGGSVKYTIPNIAMKGKDNLTTVYTYKTPLVGTYNASNDMGYVSTVNMVPATAMIDTAGNSSLPVAGASMIMGLRGITPISDDQGYRDMNIKQVALYMPNGSVRSFTLDKPLRVTYSEGRKMMVVDSYPTFTRRMRAVTGNATTAFPAGTAPMSITSLDGSWGTTTPSAISYEAPQYVQPPS